jgi:hypothetical protein
MKMNRCVGTSTETMTKKLNLYGGWFKRGVI